MTTGAQSRPLSEGILCNRCRASNRWEANFCVRCGAPLVLGRMYRVVAVIKEGGMGTVYRAIDQFGNPCALKELRDEFTDQRERHEGIHRFMEEGRLLHSLRDHPAIPEVYRTFVDNGRYYLAMEFIHGDDLEDLWEQHGRFSEEQVLLWADQLCDVLQYLHRNGLIYRDMKPSNIMVAHDGSIKVIDFGIAQALRPGIRGSIIGTPGYAPPEQYQGITTPQSDMYALAATLHQLLTGRDPRDHPPFSFPPARMLDPHISRGTDKALRRALQPEQEDRYPTVAAFREALRQGETIATDVLDRRRRPKRTRSVPHHRNRSFGQRVRRVVLAAIIGATLVYTAPDWAPALGATINDAVQRITGSADDSSFSTPIEQPPPTDQESTTALIEGRRETFIALIEIDMPANATNQQLFAAFQERFLEAARHRYPGAQLADTDAITILDPVTQTNGAQQLDAPPDRQRLRAEVTMDIVIPNR